MPGPDHAWERRMAEAERARIRAEELPEVRTDSESWERADGLVQDYIVKAQQREEA